MRVLAIFAEILSLSVCSSGVSGSPEGIKRVVSTPKLELYIT